MKSFSKENGQSLLEVILALAIFSMIAASIAVFVLGGFAGLEQGGEQTQAAALAQEGIEAVRSIRDRGWENLNCSQCAVEIIANQWVFSGAVSETIGQYTRTITLLDVYRDSNNNIVSEGAPGAVLDPNSKEVRSQVEWTIRPGITNTARRYSYLTNWETARVVACNWASLQIKGKYQYPGVWNAVKVQTQGNYAYVILGSEGSPSYNFAVMDVSNLASPQLLSTLNLPGPLTNIALSGNYAYVSSASDNRELQIVDITNPASPQSRGFYNAPGGGNGNGVYAVGATVYLIREGDRTRQEFFIINASNPSSPVLVGSADIGVAAQGGNEIWMSGNYVFVASQDTGKELKIINITNPASPQYLANSYYNISGASDGLSITGFNNTVVLGSKNGNVYFIDITNPSAITQASLISSYNVGNSALDLSLNQNNDTLFAVSDTNPNSEFHIVNISNIVSPTLISKYLFNFRLSGVTVDSGRCSAYAVGFPSAVEEFYVITPN